MDKKEIIEKVKSYNWEPWLRRGFSPFMITIFADCNKDALSKIYLSGANLKAMLFQNGVWFESHEIWKDMADSLEKPLKKHSIIEICKDFDKFKKKSEKEILKITKKNISPLEKLEKAYKIIRLSTTYVWLAHGIEEVYKRRLNEMVPKYFKHDIDKFIGDASFPKRKNEINLMHEAMQKGVKAETILKKWSWIRCRNAFDDPYSLEDIKKMIKEQQHVEKHIYPKIPKQLRKLFKEVQELVWFRTARTDLLYYLLFLARPLLKEVSNYYNIDYNELSNYSVQSLIAGKPEKFSENYGFAWYEGEWVIIDGKIIEEKEIKNIDFVKGAVAFKGIVKGTAKIVHFVSELDKVKKGDVLVTQMTFPSFISAMNKSVAFVTDEGGITCHAAIVAREMKKPCITGTKIATKIFKDGDLIEVDAINGVVKKC